MPNICLYISQHSNLSPATDLSFASRNLVFGFMQQHFVICTHIENVGDFHTKLFHINWSKGCNDV